MTENSYVYTHRAVAFLDVLGFKEKLKEFEQEAIENIEEKHYSKKANDFIEAFNHAISKLDKDKFSYYLFSDNICITAKMETNTANSYIELLMVIAELYFEFVKRGYFLRGGVDYGLFIDKASLALGVPLANAYILENLAIYPRIVLSNDFIKQISEYEKGEGSEMELKINHELIKSSCEIKYLNVFYHILKLDDKESFFENYNSRISESLKLNANKENIFIKYNWLAGEFNAFLEHYISNLVYTEEDLDATEDYLKSIKLLKISYGQ